MHTTLVIAQAVFAILLVVGIMLQPQGNGLGQAWSGGGETYHTRRGLERVIFTATIVLASLFTLTSLAVYVLSAA